MRYTADTSTARIAARRWPNEVFRIRLGGSNQEGGGVMSLTFYLILLAALALSVVLLAALAIYWHAEARARPEPMRRQREMRNES